MDNEPVLFEVTDKAVERANEYLPKVNRDDFEDEEDYIDEEVRNMADRFIYISAYHQAQKDTIERAVNVLINLPSLVIPSNYIAYFRKKMMEEDNG